MNKKVSVIMPNYNNEKYIEWSIKSVLDQSYNNIELIIIDDGSTDKSIKVIEKYTKDKRVKFLKEFNQNGSIARNRGIELSTGDYLLFLDSDDVLYDNNTIKDMVSDIKGYDLVLYDIYVNNEKGDHLYDLITQKRILDRPNKYKYAKISPMLSNKLYDKSIIDKYGLYFSNVRIGQDLNFYLKYLMCIKKINYVSKYGFRYRVLDSSITRSVNLNFIDIVTCMEEVRKFYERNNHMDEFDAYIRAVGIEHFEIESKKIKNFDNIKMRDFINNYFDYWVNDYFEKSSNRDDVLMHFYNNYMIRRSNGIIKFLRRVKRKIKRTFIKK